MGLKRVPPPGAAARKRKDVPRMERGELSWRERGRLWVRLGIRLGLAAALVLALRYLLPPLLSLFMPFVLALVAAWLLNPLVKVLQRRLGLPRGVLSLLLILLGFAAAGGLLFALGYSLFSEVSALLNNWEGAWNSFQEGVEAVGLWLDRLLTYLPVEVSDFFNDLLDRLWAALSDWVSGVMPVLGTWAGNFAMGLPAFAVAFIVFLMGTYFLTADYPRYRYLLTSRMPEEVRRFFGHIKHTALGAFGGYVRAEVIISVGVFAILLAGFLLIRQPYAVLLALILAVLDFIPIIGSGTIMIPWAAIDLLTGNWGHAVGLLVVWGVVCVFRRVAEPKAVGSQTGLSPILSLVSMYVGMRLAGVLGMILGPILCLVAINICRTGIFDGLVADLGLAVRDTAALLRREPEA